MEIQVLSKSIALGNRYEVVSSDRKYASYNDQEIRIDFTDLSCKVVGGKNLTVRPILNKISGSFGKGLNAILGGSGAGKTTFLNTLARKINTQEGRVELEGLMTANGVKYSVQQLHQFSRFVLQDDLLLPTLTVRETLQFAADLRLFNLSKEEKRGKVDEVLRTMMLEKSQNTLIGDHNNKGVSGGEKKRCNIAFELMGDPQVLFLDEPTSGLDSFTAFKIISALKILAEKGKKTVIFTIHSPSSDIWQLFDTVSFIQEGHLVYAGPRSDTIKYFADQGYQCPIYSNPADYFIQIQNEIDVYHFSSLNNCLFAERADKLAEQQLNSRAVTDRKQEMVPFSVSTKYLIKRQITNIQRNKILFKARFIQMIIMNVFTGLVYRGGSRILDSDVDAYLLVKTLFLLSIGLFFQSFNPQIIVFSSERAVFLKEEGSKLYSAHAYFLSKILLEILLSSYFSSQACSIIYWLIGFHNSVSQFFYLVFIIVLVGNVGNAFGIFSASMFKDNKIVISSSLVFLIPILLFAGVFRNFNNITSAISWIRFITPTFYSTCALSQSQLEAFGFTFDPQTKLLYNLSQGTCIGALIGLYFIINISAYSLLLRHRKQLQ